jgi:hypothetical protein
MLSNRLESVKVEYLNKLSKPGEDFNKMRDLRCGFSLLVEKRYVVDGEHALIVENPGTKHNSGTDPQTPNFSTDSTPKPWFADRIQTRSRTFVATPSRLETQRSELKRCQRCRKSPLSNGSLVKETGRRQVSRINTGRVYGSRAMRSKL